MTVTILSIGLDEKETDGNDNDGYYSVYEPGEWHDDNAAEDDENENYLP
jgi:hypothetical protein